MTMHGMTLPELVAVSLHSNHWETLPHVSAIDRIGALGFGNVLGILLFHFKEGGVTMAAGPAYRHFVRILARRFNIKCVGGRGNRQYNTLRRLAMQVMEEWMNPGCPKCQGLGALKVVRYQVGPEPTLDDVQCPLCGGQQVYKHSDYERAAALRLTSDAYLRKAHKGNAQSWAERFELALAILRDRDEAAKSVMAQHLR
jgi:hypothetical protein